MKLNQNNVILIIGVLCILGILQFRNYYISKHFKKLSDNLENHISHFDLWYGEKSVGIESNEDFVELYKRLLAKANEDKMYLRGGEYDTFVFDIYLKNGEKINFQIKFDTNEYDIFIDIQYKKVMVFQKSIINDTEELKWLIKELSK